MRDAHAHDVARHLNRPPNRRRRLPSRRWALRVGLAIVVAVGGGTALAAAGHSPLSPTATTGQQEEVGRGVNVVRQYVRAHPGSGYSTLAVDEPTESITVYWHGPVPTELSDRLTATGLQVTLRTAPYEQATLDAALRALLTPSATAALATVGISRGTVYPSPDGTGINVEYLPFDQSRPVDLEQIRRAIHAITGVAITELTRGPGDFQVQPHVRPAPPAATPPAGG